MWWWRGALGLAATVAFVGCLRLDFPTACNLDAAVCTDRADAAAETSLGLDSELGDGSDGGLSSDSGDTAETCAVDAAVCKDKSVLQCSDGVSFTEKQVCGFACRDGACFVVSQLAAGRSHTSCALLTDGTVACWVMIVLVYSLSARLVTTLGRRSSRA
jgi:hypothetical protein